MKEAIRENKNRWEDNNKTELQKVREGRGDGKELALNWDRSSALAGTIRNSQFQ
jgi:hypothetical protein